MNGNSQSLSQAMSPSILASPKHSKTVVEQTEESSENEDEAVSQVLDSPQTKIRSPAAAVVDKDGK